MSTSHPLEPLSAQEFRRVAAVLRRDRAAGPRWRFASIELKEPAKDLLAAGAVAGEMAGREAIVVCCAAALGAAVRRAAALPTVTGTLRSSATATSVSLRACPWTDLYLIFLLFIMYFSLAERVGAKKLKLGYIIYL